MFLYNSKFSRKGIGFSQYTVWESFCHYVEAIAFMFFFHIEPLARTSNLSSLGFNVFSPHNGAHLHKKQLDNFVQELPYLYWGQIWGSEKLNSLPKVIGEKNVESAMPTIVWLLNLINIFCFYGFCIISFS